MVRTAPAGPGGFMPLAEDVIAADVGAASGCGFCPRASALIEHKGIGVHTVAGVAPIEGRGDPRCGMRPLFRSMSMLRSAISLVQRFT